MELEEVWDYLDPSIKIAVKAVLQEDNHVRTRTLLPALARAVEERDNSDILKSILDETEVDFDYPESFPSEPDPAPRSVELTPCVEEAFNFFKMHKIRSVSANDLARRILQIGTGSTVRAMEEQGILDDAILRLEATL